MTTIQQIINKLAQRTASDDEKRQLAQAVSRQSKRGNWYDGPSSTNIDEWIAEGDYSGNETIESLAAEWDE